MAALTITAANVSLTSAGRVYADAVAGEAFAAGAAVYLKASDQRWYKAQCDGTAEEAGSQALGIALATADAAAARVSVASDGSVVALGTGTAGKTYCPGTVAGTLVPTADIDATSTSKVSQIAIGIGSNSVQVQRNYNAGAVVP
jgi:hypothetical protein